MFINSEVQIFWGETIYFLNLILSFLHPPNLSILLDLPLEQKQPTNRLLNLSQTAKERYSKSSSNFDRFQSPSIAHPLPSSNIKSFLIQYPFFQSNIPKTGFDFLDNW